MTPITKFATVLDLHKASPHGSAVTFKTLVEDPADREVWVTIPRRDYDDLGQPQKITISVQPGNILEEESKLEEPLLLTTRTEADEEADAPFDTAGDE
jgi:hypothetical protein